MILKALSNSSREYPILSENGTYTLEKNAVFAEEEYVDIIDESFFCRESDDGYYVIADYDGKGSRLCFFNKKQDGERVYKQNLMPIYGVKTKTRSVLVIVEGYKYDFSLIFGVKDGKYYIYPRFHLYGLVPFDDIKLRYIELPKDSGYSEMAASYRKYQLDKGVVRPLSERMKEREELAYAAECPEIRIRMGWKPAPAEILEQTFENEPKMKVACTFDRVCDIVDELRTQGVEKAQICLVGWNTRGHDGRYPQIFPVEESLGGEERLRHLIRYAKERGYQIVCHTNSTDCYSVAENFSLDIVAKNADGSLSFRPDIAWSGGRQYHLCPKCALDFAKTDLPKIKDLGFCGLHYIDVLSVVPLRRCFDKKHPCNSKETLAYYGSIMEQSRKLFGGFSSEGVFDFAAEYLDYGLYVSWPAQKDSMADKSVPLWQIVYHGIILYNNTTDTVNYPIKDEKNHLAVIEDGSRPSFYFYSKFLNGSDQDDWLGKDDITCDTDEDLKNAVSAIKKAYDEYKSLCHLVTRYIEKHEEVSDGVFKVTYSDKTVITVDYNKKEYSVE